MAPARQQRRNAAAKPAAPARGKTESPARPTRKAKDEEPEEEDLPFAAGADEDDDEDEEELPESIDFTDVPDEPAYELIPAGKYPGVIESVEYTRSQTSNNPMLVFQFSIEVQERSRGIRGYLTLAGDSLPRAKRTLSRLDPDLDLSDFNPNDANEMFADMDVTVQIRVQPDRNDPKEKRSNVRDFWPAEEEEE